MTDKPPVIGDSTTLGANTGVTLRTADIEPIALAARAAYVLRGNSGAGMTRAAPQLYPHQ